MTVEEAIAVLRRMRANLTGRIAIRAREERRAIDDALARLAALPSPPYGPSEVPEALSLSRAEPVRAEDPPDPR